jgi:hypothetical protein
MHAYHSQVHGRNRIYAPKLDICCLINSANLVGSQTKIVEAKDVRGITLTGHKCTHRVGIVITTDVVSAVILDGAV